MKVYILKEETLNDERNLYLSLFSSEEKALRAMKEKIISSIENGYEIIGGGGIGDTELYMENSNGDSITYTVDVEEVK